METHLSQQTFAVGLGSNLSDRVENIRKARRLLEACRSFGDFRHSGLVESAPWGPVSQGPYVNAVSVFSTALAPHDVLAECLRIELALGRVRGLRYGPRIIDIDLLLASRTEMEDDDLVLPHQRLHERGFVLLPLVRVWPDAWHSRFGCTVAQLWERWKNSVDRVEDYVWDIGQSERL